MGQEATCHVTLGTQRAEGVALLESTELRFTGSGGVRVRIPFSDIKSVDARKGALHVTYAAGTAAFDLGPLAEKWALKIRYPKGRIDKLGIKPTSIVSVIGVRDDTFPTELAARTSTVSTGRARRGSHFIIYGIEDTTGLAKLASLRASLVPDGAIWVVWPKGRKTVREDDVRRQAIADGLVDVKVMSFSDTLSALKLVIPVAQRPRTKKSKATA
jgi:hypothetical protein